MLPLVAVVIFPLASVARTAFQVRLVMVIPQLEVPSKMIPVVEVLFPLAVRKICWIYWIAFTAEGVISNALVMKSMHDIHRKKKVAHLMKFILLVCDDKLLLVKAIVEEYVVKCIISYRY